MRKKTFDANMKSLYQVDEEEREEREFTSPIRLDELMLDTPFRKKAFDGFDLKQSSLGDHPDPSSDIGGLYDAK